ncbi:hypothetical protein HF851_08310 [Corynebacterium ammoniagenes]|uniref:hypothetical protein n=1 Tax=Corynebacterium ammoniagenes TaxID=1697 RepID=UPI0014595EBF|nr:hypothetical protein [Corynebacterium ammoniagenes]NMF32279.1 hypothetical protein [Corynebacterium ammoniagenes]
MVVPEGTDLRPGDDSLVSFVTTTMKLLIPSGWEVPAKLVAGAQVSVRGEDYFVDGDQIDHRSPFGTGYGGVEVKLSTTPVA